MPTHPIGTTALPGSRMVYRCMRLAGDGTAQALKRGSQAIRAALDAGYTIFDHADSYVHGLCETLFGQALDESKDLRDRIVLQTRCGVRMAEGSAPAHYDLSAAHILRSVDESLRRLRTDTTHIFLLYRPDFLMDPDAIAKAMEQLRSSGKVKHVGVSNFNPSQVNLLNFAIDVPLLVNQVEVNLNTIDRLSDGTLDQCLQLGITPQAWSPLAGFAYPDPETGTNTAISTALDVKFAQVFVVDEIGAPLSEESVSRSIP